MKKLALILATIYLVKKLKDRANEQQSLGNIKVKPDKITIGRFREIKASDVIARNKERRTLCNYS